MEIIPEKEQAWFQQILERSKDTFWDLVGLRLELHPEDPEQPFMLVLQAERQHMNPAGILHGGVTATMLDTVMGLTVMRRIPGKFAVTTNMNVNYVAPLRPGTVKASAKILHQTRFTFTAEGRICDGDGVLAAIGIGSFRVAESLSK